MKSFLLLATVLATLSLTACSPAEIASNAADAAACSATHASLETLSGLYRDGLVDSGVIEQVQALIGEPVQALLSSGLAKDFQELGEIISTSGPAEETAQQIDTLVADIKVRCEAVGVTFAE